MTENTSDYLVPPIEMDLGDNPGVVTFSTFADLTTWAALEVEHWANLPNPPVPSEVLSHLKMQRNTPLALHETAIAHDRDKAEQFLKRYQDKVVVHGTSHWGRRILDTQKTDPVEAAALLWAVISWSNERAQGKGTSWITDPQFLGHPTRYIAALAQVAAISPNATIEGSLRGIAEIEKRLAASETKWRQIMSDVSVDRMAQTNEYQAFLSSSREQLTRRLEELESAVETFAAKGEELTLTQNKDAKETSLQVQHTIQELVKKANQSITDFEAQVREKVSLEAPVTYWRRKATAHKRGVIVWGAATAIVTLAPLIVIVTNSTESYRLFKDMQESLAKGGVGGVAILLAVAVLYLTFGRLISKLFSTSLALANDASERVVMAETFLALHKDQHFSDADRTLILTPLFRPHGLPPDNDSAAGVADMLSKALQR